MPNNLRQVKTQRARDYILAHPDETKQEQAHGAGVSTTLIAKIRADLIVDGLIPGQRKSTAPSVDREPKVPRTPKTPTKPRGLLDHEAMQALADMIEAETKGLSDEELHNKMMKQCITFAFNPGLHPDTRMSASQMWAKLKDQKRAADLGPGPPKTFTSAKDRMTEMMSVAGWRLTIAALKEAFPELAGAAPDDEAEHPPSVGGTEEAPQPA